MPAICFDIALLTSTAFLNVPAVKPYARPQRQNRTNRIGIRPFKSGDPINAPFSPERRPVKNPIAMIMM